MEILFLIGRIIFGGYFIYNGINHLWNLEALTQYATYENVPWPRPSVIVTGVMLLLGGLSILLGYMVVIGSWLLIIFLVAAAFLVHNYWMEVDPGSRANQQAHFLKNIALAAANLILFTIPNWPLSLGG